MYWSKALIEEARKLLRWQLLGGEISGFEFNRKNDKLDEIERKQKVMWILNGPVEEAAEKKAEKKVVTEAAKEAMRWQVQHEKPSTAHRMNLQRPKPPKE